MKRNLDTIAKKYIENRGFESILTKYKIKKILKLCKGNYALDLGCGVGLITKELSKVFRKVVAIDGSVKKIKIAKKFIKKPNVIFYNQMFNSFNPKEKFDTIVMSNILEHVDNPILLLKKSRNWLNSDGIIIATVPNAQAFHKKIGLHSGIIKNLFELTKEDIEKGHKRVYDRNRFREKWFQNNRIWWYIFQITFKQTNGNVRSTNF
jgi:2-polyprenyl-3-methyl-5-hydroxy-6-metoxy-1,4-benzoquinol methylase